MKNMYGYYKPFSVLVSLFVCLSLSFQTHAKNPSITGISSIPIWALKILQIDKIQAAKQQSPAFNKDILKENDPPSTFQGLLMPMAECPMDTTVFVAMDSCGVTVGDIALTTSGTGTVARSRFILSGGTDSISPLENPADVGLADASGIFFGLGTTTVSYIVVENQTSTDTCMFNVIVRDTFPPSITCPADATVMVSNLLDDSVIAGLMPTTSDNCDTVTVTNNFMNVVDDIMPSDLLGLDTTVAVTYYAEDLSGNIDSCTFNVTLMGTSIELECPSDTTVIAPADSCSVVVGDIGLNVVSPDAGAIDSILYEFSGATVLDSVGLNDASGTLFNGDTTVVTYTVVDTSGNRASCSFEVVVKDETPPVIVCQNSPRFINIPEDSTGGIANNIGLVSIMDNCDMMPMVSYEFVSGTNAGVSGMGDASGIRLAQGRSELEYTVTDAGGNSATCSFEVNVNPFSVMVDCISDTTVALAANECQKEVNVFPTVDFPNRIANATYTLMGATQDTMTIDTLFDNPLSFNVGPTVVNYTIVSSALDTFTCNFTVTVQDTIPLAFENCPANISLEPSAMLGDTAAVATWTVPNLNDTCSTTVISTHMPGDTFALGMTTVQYLASNTTGEFDTCTFTVSVENLTDTIPPVFDNCPMDTVLFMTADTCGVVYDGTMITATDNFQLDTIIADTLIGTFFTADTTMVTYTARDTAGNVATCSYNVIVRDTIAPMFANCPSDTTINSRTGLNPRACGQVFVPMAPTAMDNCEFELTDNTPNDNAYPVGETTITYTARDSSGNEATCSFVLTVIDIAAPQLSGCPDTVSVPISTSNCQDSVIATWNEEMITAIDNCGSDSLTITSTHSSGDMFEVGTTVVSYIATDMAGNADTCMFPVIVSTQAEIECPEDVVAPNLSGECQGTASWTAPAPSSDCSNFTVTSNFEPGDTFPVGMTEVIYFIIGEGSDTTRCSFIVEIQDQERPMFMNCPMDTTISTEPGDCAAIHNWEAPTAMDNCGVVNIDSTYASGDIFLLGETVVEYMAMDAAGNIDTCSFTVTVVDLQAPIISCPDTVAVSIDGTLVSDESAIINAPPVTMDCDSIMLSFDLPSVTDGCDSTVTLVQTDSTGLMSGSIFNLGMTTLSYEAVDSAGNRATCDFVINVLPLDTIDITVSDSMPCQSDSLTFIAGTLGLLESEYIWSGAFNDTGRVVTVLAADLLPDTTVMVSVDAGNSCIFTGMIEVKVSEDPQPMIVTNGTCAGFDILVSVEDTSGVDISTFIWDYPGIGEEEVNDMSQTITNATEANSGVYTVTTISAEGCTGTATDTFTIASKPIAPELFLSPLRDSACTGDEFMLIGTIDTMMGITYNFASTPDTGLVLMPSDTNVATVSFQEPNDYTLMYWIDNQGCTSDTASVDLFVGERPTLIASFEGANLCTSVDSSLQFFETGGEANNWTWIDPMGEVFSNAQNPSLKISNVISGDYIVVSTIGSCEARDTVSVELVSDLVTPVLSPIDFACTTDTIALSLLEPYDSTTRFIWTSTTPGLIETPITTDTAFLALVPMGLDTMERGVIMVRAVQGSCSSSVDSISFDLMQGIEIDLSGIQQRYTCVGSDLMIELPTINSVDSSLLNWRGPCGFMSNTDSTANFIVDFDDALCRSGEYVATVVGANGCESVQTVDIQFEQGTRKLKINGASTYCEGEDIVLSIDSSLPEGGEVVWTGPEGFTTMDAVVRVNAQSFLTGGFNVTLLSDTTGCPPTVSDTFDLTVIAQPDLIDDDFSVAMGELDSLNVLANDGLFLADSASINVSSNPLLGSAFFDTTNNILVYSPSNEGVGFDNFTYQVCYQLCQDPKEVLCDEAVVNVTINFPDDVCMVADFITPNNDGKNDNLIISCVEGDVFPDNELIIFNEWGGEVFRANPYNNDWDGTFDGKELPDGTYFYIFIPGEETDVQKGFFTLFR
ncbi:MAG: HYR domain-containing protein [Bacteroidota bacterium]